MMAYHVRLSRAVMAVTSRLRLRLQEHQYQADRLMLTSGLELVVCLDRGRIIIWRLSASAKRDARSKYTTDKARADDEDIDLYLYEDTADDTQQATSGCIIITRLTDFLRNSADNANELIQQQKEPRCRYMLKIDSVPDCVVLTSDMLLVVGSKRGDILVFNLRVIAYLEEFQHQQSQFATVLPEVHHDGHITTVCLSTKSDERYIVCGSADATLSVFDRQLNHRQSILVGHDDQVLCASICPCDWFVASGSSDCSIRLWQLTTGCQLAVFDACVDVYSVVVYRQDDHDGQLRLAALGHRQAARKLMLFRTYNIDTTNAAEQF